MDRKLLKEWTDILTPWIQVLALIAAGAFALTEYVGSKKETRIERASQYLTRFGSEEINAARNELGAREQALADRLRTVLLNRQQSQAQRNVAYYKLIVEELVAPGTKESLEAPFLRILRSLEEGATCAKQGLCDEDTIRDGNGDIGRAFVHTYGPYICYLRDTWNDPDAGKRVEHFYNLAGC